MRQPDPYGTVRPLAHRQNVLLPQPISCGVGAHRAMMELDEAMLRSDPNIAVAVLLKAHYSSGRHLGSEIDGPPPGTFSTAEPTRGTIDPQTTAPIVGDE